MNCVTVKHKQIHSYLISYYLAAWTIYQILALYDVYRRVTWQHLAAHGNSNVKQ